jgi:hypothetical protein
MTSYTNDPTCWWEDPPATCKWCDQADPALLKFFPADEGYPARYECYECLDAAAEYRKRQPRDY